MPQSKRKEIARKAWKTEEYHRRGWERISGTLKQNEALQEILLLNF